MIYTIDEIKEKIKSVADQYDILEVRLFGSYFNGTPTQESDVDLIVKYDAGCRGLDRIQFMNDVEVHLGKTVDVINIEFLPDFLPRHDLEANSEQIYLR